MIKVPCCGRQTFNLLFPTSREKERFEPRFDELSNLLNENKLQFIYFSAGVPLYKSILKVHIYNHKRQASTLSFGLFILCPTTHYIQHDKFISLLWQLGILLAVGGWKKTTLEHICFLYKLPHLRSFFFFILSETLF